MISRDWMEAVSRLWLRGIAAGENNKLNQAGKMLGAVPFRKCLPLVGTHQPEQARLGKLSSHGFGCAPRVTGWSSDKIMVIDFCPVIRRGGKPAHCQAVLFAGVLHACFVWGLPAGQKDDLIDAQCIPGGFGNMNVAQMYRIKGAAEETNMLCAGRLIFCFLVCLL